MTGTGWDTLTEAQQAEIADCPLCQIHAGKFGKGATVTLCKVHRSVS